jgi:FdhD protein
MTSRPEHVRVLRPDGVSPGERAIAVEAPVAVEVNGFGYAVMMMTPADLPEFATGFLLTERLIDATADILDTHVFEGEAGWILRVTVAERVAARIGDRIRHRSSDTSCGLCGLSGLEQLRRPVSAAHPRPIVTGLQLFAALSGLRVHQILNQATGATHAAAACDGSGAILAIFEDVGRHNALDKLIGRLALTGTAPAFLLVTSRISFEMVDKALVAAAPLLVGISAPTSLAIDHARAHQLTLLALARPDAMLVINDPHHLFDE